MTACGGNNSSETGVLPADDAPSDDGSANNDGGDLPDFVVSGALTANDAFQIDSDINDSLSDFSDNNSFATAQLLPNPAVVKGFATATPTNSDSDRFENSTDEFDVFRISAYTNQTIMLEIADFDPLLPSSVDMDLGLFSDSGALLETSFGVNNSFEAIVVPSDGDYFLAVNAYTGGSNYTLTITTEFATAALGSQLSIRNMRSDRLAMTQQPDDAENIEFVTNLSEKLGRSEKSALQSDHASLELDAEQVLEWLEARQKVDSGKRDERRTLASMQTPTSENRKTDSSLDSLSMLDMVKSMNSREGKDLFEILEYPSVHQAFDSDPVPDRFLQWNLGQIGWTEAQEWLQDITLEKRPVLAVIDSGFFVEHPDLAEVLIDQRDFVPAVIDGDGFVADASDDVFVNDDPQCHGFHGTHVATTAVAPQNNAGITGVAPGTGLIGIKIGHSSGDNCGLFGDLANAILYAAGLPNSSGSVPAVAADVINMSLGGPRPDPTVSSAIQRAVAEGVIVVASAGNDGAPVVTYPAADDNVIAVAATDLAGERALYSSFYSSVDIAAPGGDVSADLNGDGLGDGVLAGIAAVSGSEFRSSWNIYNGTSMASPTAAAGFALMKSIEPSLTQSDIETMLAAGSLTIDIGATGFDNETGFGLMSLPRMIESAVNFSDNGGAAPVTVVAATPASLDFGASLDTVSLELVQSGSGDSVAVDSVTASETLVQANGTSPIGFVGPGSVDGFGRYTFSLDRSALEAGALSGTITFGLSNGTTYVVPVSAVNQVVQGIANSAAVYFIIERLASDGTFETLEEQFSMQEGVRGSVVNSPDLEEGSYRFTYGTDMDNDRFICDQGELCGTFPFNNAGYDAAFVLAEDISGVSFLLQNVANVALASFDGSRFPSVEPRRIIKAMTVD